MKRLSAALLALALLLTACAGAPVGDASSQPASSTGASPSSVLPSREDASSALLSSDETASAFSSGTAPSSRAASSAFSSSAAASSKAPSSREPEAPIAVPIDADGIFAASRLRMNDDVSSCFPADATAFIINGGTPSRPYLVDKATLRRLAMTPCSGKGYVKWKDFKKLGSNPDPFTGVIPASKLNDPVFMSMNLPSEAPTFMSARINPENMSLRSGPGRALAIGAIYRNTDVTLADDETFTVCLGRICLALKTTTEDWSLGNDLPFPTNPSDIYSLPWEIGKQYKLPSDRRSKTDDHVEITLTGYDLNGSKYREQGAKGAVLHFWGSFASVDSFNDVKGMVSSYVAWVKEPAAVGKLVGTIGIDLYPPVSSNDNYTSEIKQAYSGYNHLLKTEPRIIFGHNVGPEAYDSVMDSEKVQKLIGLK